MCVCVVNARTSQGRPENANAFAPVRLIAPSRTIILILLRSFFVCLGFGLWVFLWTQPYAVLSVVSIERWVAIDIYTYAFHFES